MDNQNTLSNYIPGNENFLDDTILFSQKSQYETNEVHNQNNNNNNNQNQPQAFISISSSSSSSLNNIQDNCNNDIFKDDKHNIKNAIKYTNHTLKSFGFSCLGDLMSNKDEEIQKTLNTIYELIQQRIKDIEFRKEIFEKIAKLESDKSMLMQNIERLKQENHNLSKEIGQLNNNYYQYEKKAKLDKEKLINEKEEYIKQLTKANQKHIQYQHELRKKEVEANRVKEQMRKPLFEKTGSFKHSAEVISSNNQGIIISGFTHKQNMENDSINTLNNTIDTSRIKLLTENQELRNILAYFQNELGEILKEKKEEFITKKISEMNDLANQKETKAYYESFFNESDYIVIKASIYQMPIERIAGDLMQIFKENFKIFRNFWTKIIGISYPPEFFKDISKDLIEVDQNFTKVKNFCELKKALGGIKKKFFDNNNNRPPLKQNRNDRQLIFYNSKSNQNQFNNNSQVHYRHSLSHANLSNAEDSQLINKSELNVLDLLENKNIVNEKSSQNDKAINQDCTKPKNKFSILKKYSVTPNKADISIKNENIAPIIEEQTKKNHDKLNELLNFKKDDNKKVEEDKLQFHERRKTTGEINKWKIALNSRNSNQ